MLVGCATTHVSTTKPKVASWGQMMAIRFAGRRGNKPNGDKGWDIRLRVAVIVLTILSMSGTAYAWWAKHVNPDFSKQVNACAQLYETAARVSAAKTKETALTELGKYEVIYRGAAHALIKDKDVIASKISFFWTAKDEIDKGKVPSDEISAASVRLSESCKSMRKPWL